MQSDLTLALNPRDDFAAAAAYGETPGDDFGQVGMPLPGFCGRHYCVEWEVANGEVGSSGPLTLPSPVDFAPDDIAALHFALVGVDDHAHLFGGAQHLYMGVSIVKVAVIIGEPQQGRARYELRDPATRFLDFAAEGAERALPILQVQGRRLVQHLAGQALAELLSKLIARTPR